MSVEIASAFVGVLDHLPEDLGLMSPEESASAYYANIAADVCRTVLLPHNNYESIVWTRKKIEKMYLHKKGLVRSENMDVVVSVGLLAHKLVQSKLIFSQDFSPIDSDAALSSGAKFRFKRGAENMNRAWNFYSQLAVVAKRAPLY